MENNFGWRVRFDSPIIRDGTTLHLFRYIDQYNISILTVGNPLFTTVPAMSVIPENAGIMLPVGAMEAIKESFGLQRNELEIKRLEDSLRLEQLRVDTMIERLQNGVGL